PRSSYSFQATPTSATYTLSLHDALPIWRQRLTLRRHALGFVGRRHALQQQAASCIAGLYGGTTSTSFDWERSGIEPKARFLLEGDRKSTRLNSSHVKISYAVFCLKKKKK